MLNLFRLADDDHRRVRELAVEIARSEENLEEERFLAQAVPYSHELPRRIREVFYEFKMRESAPALLIVNNPVGPDDVGPTPRSQWRPGERRPLKIPQLIQGLYGALLGETFGFVTQQNGRIFNDLITRPGAAGNSSSGVGEIGLHTEDASDTQPYMPDYLSFMCLRNGHGAGTTLSSIEQSRLPEDVRVALLETPFYFKYGGQRTVLFGDPQRPYLRFGAIDPPKCSPDMLVAFRLLSDMLERNKQCITLATGDCLFLDNLNAVHGRAPFDGVCGPDSRWFSRIFVLRDLRRIRPFTTGPEGRIFDETSGEGKVA
jgi:hypothetical protein